MLNKITLTFTGEPFKVDKTNAVPVYLLASYAYYWMDDPLLSDGDFDDLSKFMLGCWGDIDHRHKDLPF